MLWELAHLPTLPTSLVQQALEEHLGILSDAYAVKETVKRSYIIKCIEDIKKVRQTATDAQYRLCGCGGQCLLQFNVLPEACTQKQVQHIFSLSGFTYPNKRDCAS